MADALAALLEEEGFSLDTSRDTEEGSSPPSSPDASFVAKAEAVETRLGQISLEVDASVFRVATESLLELADVDEQLSAGRLGDVYDVSTGAASGSGPPRKPPQNPSKKSRSSTVHTSSLEDLARREAYGDILSFSIPSHGSVNESVESDPPLARRGGGVAPPSRARGESLSVVRPASFFTRDASRLRTLGSDAGSSDSSRRETQVPSDSWSMSASSLEIADEAPERPTQVLTTVDSEPESDDDDSAESPYGALPSDSVAKRMVSERPSARDIFAVPVADDGEGDLPIFEASILSAGPTISLDDSTATLTSAVDAGGTEGSFLVRGRNGQELSVTSFSLALAEAAQLHGLLDLLNHSDPATREHSARVLRGFSLNETEDHAVIHSAACQSLSKLLAHRGDVGEIAMRCAAIISRTPENQLVLIETLDAAIALDHIAGLIESDPIPKLALFEGCVEFISNFASRAVGRKKLLKLNAGKIMCEAVCSCGKSVDSRLFPLQELLATALGTLAMDVDGVHGQFSLEAEKIVASDWLVLSPDPSVREAAAVCVANVTNACATDSRIRELLVGTGVVEALCKLLVSDGGLVAGSFAAKGCSMALANLTNSSTEVQLQLINFGDAENSSVCTIIDALADLGMRSQKETDNETLLGVLMCLNNLCDNPKATEGLKHARPSLAPLIQKAFSSRDGDIEREGTELCEQLGAEYVGIDGSRPHSHVSRQAVEPMRNTLGRRVSKSKLVDVADETEAQQTLQQLARAAAAALDQSVSESEYEHLRTATQSIREMCCPGSVVDNCRVVVEVGGVELLIDSLENIVCGDVRESKPPKAQDSLDAIYGDPQMDFRRMAAAIDILKAVKYCGRLEPDVTYQYRQLPGVLLQAISNPISRGSDETGVVASYLVAVLDLVAALAFTLSMDHGEGNTSVASKALIQMVPPIVKLLKYTHSLRVRQKSVRALAVIAGIGKKFQAAIGKAGGATEFLHCIKRPSSIEAPHGPMPGQAASAHTSLALQHLRQDPTSEVAGSASVGIVQVAGASTARGETLLQLQALRGIRVLSLDSHNQDRLRKAGVASTVARVLSDLVESGTWSSDQKDLGATVMALGAQLCSRSDKMQAQFRQVNIFQSLCKACITCLDPVVAFHTTSFMVEVARDNTRNADALMSAGAVDAVLCLAKWQCRDTPRSPIVLNLLSITFCTAKKSKRKQRWVAAGARETLKALADMWTQVQNEKSLTNDPANKKPTETELQIARGLKTTLSALK
jgi:hypothetical protein